MYQFRVSILIIFSIMRNFTNLKINFQRFLPQHKISDLDDFHVLVVFKYHYDAILYAQTRRPQNRFLFASQVCGRSGR